MQDVAVLPFAVRLEDDDQPFSFRSISSLIYYRSTSKVNPVDYYWIM